MKADAIAARLEFLQGICEDKIGTGQQLFQMSAKGIHT